VFDAILMASEVLAGSTIAFLLFYFFLVVKSTRRGRDHLALDGTYFHGDGPAPGSGDSTA